MRVSIIQSFGLLLAVTTPLLAMPLSSNVDISTRADATCNATPSIFTTTRCLLKRVSNAKGTRASPISAQAVWKITDNLWTKVVHYQGQAASIQAQTVEGVTVRIGIPYGGNAPRSFSSLVDQITGAGLWDMILKAVQDTVDNNPGISSYTISSLEAQAMATISVSSCSPDTFPNWAGFPSS
jgi:hypothetical protein